MDRVKIAVDMLHYNVPEAQRDDAFRQGYQRLVIAQFGSGVNDEIREQIFGVPDPPATIAAVLAAATAVENEKHSKASKLIVNQVEDEKKPKLWSIPRKTPVPIGDLTGQWDTGYEEEEWGYDEEYGDYENGYDYQEHQGSGNDPWGRY